MGPTSETDAEVSTSRVDSSAGGDEGTTTAPNSSTSDAATSGPEPSTGSTTTSERTSGVGESSSSTGIQLPECGTGRFPTNAVPYNGFDQVGAWGTVDSIALGDLNGDDQPDLVVSDLSSQVIRTLLGQIGGDFGTVTSMDSYSPSLAIGPIADAQPDLVSFTRPNSATTASVVRRWRGLGNGSFGPASDFTMTPSGQDIALADLNGDNRLDAITSASTSIEVHLGNAAEAFDTPIRYESPWAFEISTADLDTDGFVDVLVPTLDGGFVWWGTGNGGLDGPTALGALPSRATAIGDFNGDLLLDVAISTDAVVEVYAGDGQRGFAPLQQLTVLSPVVSMAGVDLDDDRCDDIVVTGGNSALPYFGSVGVLMSLGDDAFEEEQSFSIEGEYGRDIAVADLNDDGIEDIVVGARGGAEGRVLVLYSDG
ncbi:MAG: FG-GAP repeat domain-containing protein [Nannocystales bacterium]